MSPFVYINEFRCDSETYQAKQRKKGYKLPTHTKFRRITHAPEILVIRLDRTNAVYNSKSKNFERKNLGHKTTYGDTLDLTKYSALMEDSIRYQLRTVTTHMPSGNDSGHYVAGVTREKGMCTLVNDRLVRQPTADLPPLLSPCRGLPFILVYSKMTTTAQASYR